MQLFITGIGTEIGKTLVSAIFTEALQADYFKVLQSGNLDELDRDTVKNLISNSNSKFHNEKYLLSQPLSPHTSAAIDGIEIKLDNIILPQTNNHLIIEGAGGVLVPLNKKETILDLIKKINVPIVLVSKNYLGSINHTLLTFEILKANNIQILGLVFNGDLNESGETWIENYTKLPVLLRVKNEINLSPEIIKKYAVELKNNLTNLKLL
jgi:dethiobiotin synthetase